MDDHAAAETGDQQTDAALTRPAEPTVRAWTEGDELGMPLSDDRRKPLSHALLLFLALVLFSAGGVTGWMIARNQHRDQTTVREATPTPTAPPPVAPPTHATQPDPVTARRDAEFLRTAHAVKFVNDDPARAITLAHQICTIAANPTHTDRPTQLDGIMRVKIETDYGIDIGDTDAGVIVESAQLVYCPETWR